MPSIDFFKRSIRKQYEITKYPWYEIGDRFANIHNACLRIECSMLNAHLYYNPVGADNPGCRCGNNCEDPQHYFFYCIFYTDQRASLISSLTSYLPVNLDLLLYGDPNLSLDVNTEMTLAVHNYITETGRFFVH